MPSQPEQYELGVFDSNSMDWLELPIEQIGKSLPLKPFTFASSSSSYLVGTWAEHVRQRENRLTGADRRFEEQARGYALEEPQVAHLFPPPAIEPPNR